MKAVVGARSDKKNQNNSSWPFGILTLSSVRQYDHGHQTVTLIGFEIIIKTFCLVDNDRMLHCSDAQMCVVVVGCSLIIQSNIT